ncbi:MAG: PRC-barrel domain-containing protein [Hyphomicrobium sp.]
MKFSLTALAAALMLSTAAIAQTTSTEPANPSATAPAEKITPPITPEAATSPADSTAMPATPAAESATAASGPMLSDDEAKAWIDKVVYSSDDKNLGEVSAVERDATGHVKEIHADIGGFLGLGETRVRVTPSQFKLVGDKLVLNVTGDSAKSLPKVEG